MIDGKSEQILTFLQEDSRLSNAEIGRQVGLTPSAVLERIRKLQQAGQIEEFTARLDRRSVGYCVTAFIHLRTDASLDGRPVVDALAQIPEILEIHDVSGPDCYLLKVVARDIDHLHQLIHERIGAIEAATSTSTTVVLRTFKETSQCPIHLSASQA